MDRQDATELRQRPPRAVVRRVAPDDLSPATTGLVAETIRHDADLLALRPAWDALHRAAGADAGETLDPFSSWTWMWHWWRARAAASRFAQPRYRLDLFVLRDEGRVVRAIVPFVEARWGIGALAVRARRQFGFGPTTADLRGPLVWPGWEGATADALTDHLRATDGRRVDLTIVDGIPESGLLTQRLMARATGEGWGWGPSVPAHQLQLGTDWVTFRAGFKGHLKKSVRHGYNSLAREGHAWTFEAVDEPAQVPAALDQFFRLHAARAAKGLQPRHLDYYADAADRAALSGIAEAMVREGRLAICRLRVDGDVVAARLAFTGRDAIYLHDAGADPAWSRFAVATTLTAECLRWAIERGIRVTHLGTGEDPSKSRWRGRQRMLRRLEVVAPTPAGRLLAMVRRLPDRARGLSIAVVPWVEELPPFLLA